jgi:hypothetical protein
MKLAGMKQSAISFQLSVLSLLNKLIARELMALFSHEAVSHQL